MITLPAYLKTHRISQQVFADKIGVTQATVSKMCRERPVIGFETALRVEKATGGQVRLEAWPQFSGLLRRIPLRNDATHIQDPASGNACGIITPVNVEQG